MKANKKDENESELQTCFVLMPISDPDGYAQGHFGRIYVELFQPACELAGYSPIRSDEVFQTNLIQLDILKKLLDVPMVLCDLSSRNPNVMFELGIRQAFDKPVVLVQEVVTKPIFDISGLRYTEYRNQRLYNEVIEDQQKIANAIISTKNEFDSGQGINSIVKLLELTKSASLKDIDNPDKDQLIQLLRADIGSLRQEFRENLGYLSSELEAAIRQTKSGYKVNQILEATKLSKLPKFTQRKTITDSNHKNEESEEKFDINDIISPSDDDIPF
ncbi:MAG: hypothetical protein WA584_10840 [Pyrinomonadaceae bacterium]